MADMRYAVPLGAAVLAGIVWYAWTYEGQTHNVTGPSFFSEEQYDPYVWWAGHSKGNAYVHHYPEKIGQNCLPEPLDNQEGSYSTTFSEAAYG